MKTFFVQTLGCRVNHYESDQIAELLRSRGLTPAGADVADLRVVNTCSVTTQAASQSRQSVRRLHKLPVLSQSNQTCSGDSASSVVHASGLCLQSEDHSRDGCATNSSRRRVLVTGCWATSNPAEAAAMPGVDAVLGHHHDLALELDHLLTLWQREQTTASSMQNADHIEGLQTPPEFPGIDNSLKIEAGHSEGQITEPIEPNPTGAVNRNLQTSTRDDRVIDRSGDPVLPPLPEYRERGPDQERDNQASQPTCDRLIPTVTRGVGAVSLPLLGRRQPGRQRAYLKIQDGCDAHCTYCIIPSLRPNLWSKPVAAAVAEAQALVDAGHIEIVLTGIFLGAYGQPTALRRRQPRPTAEPLGELIEALCENVKGLRRLRLSSLEPGDLTPDLIAVLRSHPQVMPHFHLPLQSGSDPLLRKMNRQYTRDDFLQMVDNVNAAFDRPALTTDIVVGFPGEDDAEFEETASLVRAAGFIHVHAFPYSPRPGTAAARWTDQFIRGPVVNERIGVLRELAENQSYVFRQSFEGDTMEVIVEQDSQTPSNEAGITRHGRCERYFPIYFDQAGLSAGDAVEVMIENVERNRTIGRTLSGRWEP